MPKAQDVSQEVRFAIVLYGGVSLAIYINGVAQELRNLVRATSGEPLAADEINGPVPVYQRLASLLERGKIPSGQLPANDRSVGPIRTRFKVDVISGTSAGGINGIFLAKSLANNVPMTSLQDLWFEEGAIENLLNDKRSYQGIKVTQPPETESLLNSRRMYLKLLNAFDSMDGGDRSAVSRDGAVSPLTEEIDLFATTTDIRGIPVPIQLFDNVVYERRYRNSFHLRFAGGERNDFQADNNPFLAFAARCTSSFPFAFEPMQLCSIDDILKRNPIYAKKQYCLSGSTRWQKYYTNYLEGVLGGTTEFPQRSFGDGGYLNNAPFSFAVDALLQRQSNVPVQRKLIYVEPSPAHPEETAEPPDAPNAIANSIDALITIPGYQTIRNDLMRVLERNRAVTKINKTLAEAEQDIEAQARKIGLLEKDASEIWFSREICYRAYYHMRAAEVTDLIALMVARTRSIDEDSAHFSALRSLIRAWREALVLPSGTEGQEQTQFDGLEAFLAGFDLPYRLRRLRLLERKLDGLYGLTLDVNNPAYTDAQAILRFGLEGASATAEMPAGLRELRAIVGRQHHALKQLLDELLRAPEPPDNPPPPSAETEVRGVAFVSSALPDRANIMDVLSKILQINQSTVSDGEEGAQNKAEAGKKSQWRLYATEATVRKSSEPRDLEILCDLRARHELAENKELAETLKNLGNVLRSRLKQTLDRVHAEVTASFQGTAAGRIARRFYLYFDLFDAIQFPMMFGTDIVVSDPVEIVRIAPEDAARLVPEIPDRRQKLKGLAVAHFGAFLDRDWRVSDLLWGRLDAAERIIGALLPWEDSRQLRDQLIDQAHSAILADFQVPRKLKDMATRQVLAQGPENRLNDETVRSLVDLVTPNTIPPSVEMHRELMDTWKDVVPQEMNRRSQLETMARSTTIVGRMLETISVKSNLPPSARWLTNAGRAFWGVAEISVPRSALQLLGTYWQSLLFLIAAILIVAGAFSSKTGVAGVGWSLFAIAVLLFTVRTILSSYMRGGKALRAIAAVIVLVLLLLLGVGVWQSYRWIVNFTAGSGLLTRICAMCR